MLFKRINLAIPEENIVQETPHKIQDFAPLFPCKSGKHIFGAHEEDAYHQMYRQSYFAYSYKKASWDCLRHYEILANGSIPFFPDLTRCPEGVLDNLPKNLILEAMSLAGVSANEIDFSKFPTEQYFDLLEKVLTHTRQNLTTKALAKKVLNETGNDRATKALFLSGESQLAQSSDYQRCLLLHGMRQLLGEGLVDFPKVSHLYKLPAGADETYIRTKLDGKGFSYAFKLENLAINRKSILQKISNKYFDVIIYGQASKGLPFFELVAENYDGNNIICVDTEDSFNTEIYKILAGKVHYYVREAHDLSALEEKGLAA